MTIPLATPLPMQL